MEAFLRALVFRCPRCDAPFGRMRVLLARLTLTCPDCAAPLTWSIVGLMACVVLQGSLAILVKASPGAFGEVGSGLIIFGVPIAAMPFLIRLTIREATRETSSPPEKPDG